MRYTLYNYNGLVIERFKSKAAAIHAYKTWANACTLFDGNEIILSKR